ncbi:MAG: eL32 family ribosomal protein, partial [Promethearchaeota archaeon]
MTSYNQEKKEKSLPRLHRIRKNLKRKRPNFRRYESWRYKRVPERWRRARGIDSHV